jgi:hypothetical protein
MDLLGNLGGLLGQLTGGQGNVEENFDKVSQAVPQSSLAEALGAAFRSDQTPPFAQMAAQMFGGANGSQQASVLNTLLAAAGPAVLGSLMGGGKMGGLGGLLGGLMGGGAGPAAATMAPQLTEEQAAQVSPEAVQELAQHLEKHDPSIIDKLSSVYAEHPGLIKGLGGAALTIALAKIAEKHGS